MTNDGKVFCLIVLTLILFGCSQQSHWTSAHIHSEDKESCSNKLSYFSKDHLHGIDIEFLKIGERLNIYLNTHSTPVPAHNDSPKKAIVKIKTLDGVYSFETYRFEGGQKFLLPEEASQMLISALQSQDTPTVILPGYRSIIEVEDFSEKFDRLDRQGAMKNPFRSPL